MDSDGTDCRTLTELIVLLLSVSSTSWLRDDFLCRWILGSLVCSFGFIDYSLFVEFILRGDCEGSNEYSCDDIC